MEGCVKELMRGCVRVDGRVYERVNESLRERENEGRVVTSTEDGGLSTKGHAIFSTTIAGAS